MTSKTYDRLKWVTLVLLPALASLYFALGQLWHFPKIEEVVGTITIIDTSLGLLIGKSSASFQKDVRSTKIMGDIMITQDVDGTPISSHMEMDDRMPVFEEGTIAGFRVKRQPLG